MSAPRQRRKWLFALVVLAAIGFGVGAWLTWRHDHLPALPLAHQVPQQADAVVWLDRLDAAARGLRRLTDRVAGARGVREAMQMFAEVDLLDRDAVEKAGLRTDAGVVLFRWKGALWLALPVADDKGAAHVQTVLKRRGYTCVGQNPWQVMDRQDAQKPVAEMRVKENMLLLAWAIAEKPGTFADLDAAPKRQVLTGGAGEVHAQMQVVADGPELTALHGVLGPANLVLGGLIDRIERLDADLQLDAPQPALHVRMASKPGALADIADYHMRFLPDAPGALLDLGQLLPDETPLLLRARLNPAILGLVPQALRDALLPTSALGAWHPALNGVDFQRAVLQAWDGQVAAVLLGVADDTPLDPNAWTQRSWRKDLRFALAFSTHTDTEADTLQQAVRAALETSADKPTTAQFRDWSGFAIANPDAPWWLLRHGRHVVLVSGRGEGEDLERIASGKFPDLRAAATAPVEKALLDGAGRWLGALVETPRLARALRRRGVPDYAVKLLAAVQSVAVGVSLDADALSLDVQVRPSAEATP
jgi:hypothetical protein